MSRNEAFDIGYRGHHQPPAEGAPLHDLTNPAHDSAMPDDVYTHPHFYDHGGQDYDHESRRVVKSAKGRPDATVPIYRAVPAGVQHINPGDWVAVSKKYAQQHAISSSDSDPDMHVLEARVPAKHVRNGGNDIVEWGYGGTEPLQAKVHKPPARGWPGSFR